MHTDRTVTRMSSDRVAIRLIVNRMTDTCEIGARWDAGRSMDCDHINYFLQAHNVPFKFCSIVNLKLFLNYISETFHV